MTALPSANPAVLYRELRAGCLLYHPDTNEAHALNLAAAYVWTCCDGETDLPTMAAQLSRDGRISLDRAQQDVRAALRDLHAKQLIL